MLNTPHLKIDKEMVAKTVLMAGDPLRTKFIAENYLENPVLINDVRGMLAYTGTYKGTKITLMTSGMGIPSMGIYAYEIFNFLDVDNIIRIGSSGSYHDNIKIMDLVLSSKAYTESNFAYSFASTDCKEIESSKELDNVILNTSKKLGLDLKYGNTFCGECFDPYLADDKLKQRIPKDALCIEMEAFALFYLAKYFNKNASCILTVSDSIADKRAISSDERQTALVRMIELALETCVELGNKNGTN